MIPRALNWQAILHLGDSCTEATPSICNISTRIVSFSLSLFHSLSVSVCISFNLCRWLPIDVTTWLQIQLQLTVCKLAGAVCGRVLPVPFWHVPSECCSCTVQWGTARLGFNYCIVTSPQIRQCWLAALSWTRTRLQLAACNSCIWQFAIRESTCWKYNKYTPYMYVCVYVYIYLYVCKCYKAKSFAALAQNAQHVAFSFIYLQVLLSHISRCKCCMNVCMYVCVCAPWVCVRGRVAFKPQIRLGVTILWPRTWL